MTDHPAQDRSFTLTRGAVGGWPDLDGENALTAPVVPVQLNDFSGETELVLTVQFSEYLDVGEVQELMRGGCRDGWGANIDRVKDSTAMTPVTSRRTSGSHTHDFPGYEPVP